MMTESERKTSLKLHTLFVKIPQNYCTLFTWKRNFSTYTFIRVEFFPSSLLDGSTLIKCFCSTSFSSQNLHLLLYILFACCFFCCCVHLNETYFSRFTEERRKFFIFLLLLLLLNKQFFSSVIKFIQKNVCCSLLLLLFIVMVYLLYVFLSLTFHTPLMQLLYSRWCQQTYIQ